MNNGWIHLHRRILENPWVNKDNDHFAVWIHLLLLATHQERRVIFKGEEIVMKPGQLLTGREYLARACRVNESKVQRILNCFKNAQQIEQCTTPRGRLITILKWHKYQSTEQLNEQSVNNQRTTSERLQEGKNERMKETILPPTPQTGGTVVARVKRKKREYTEQEMQRAGAFLQTWNEIHGTRYKSADALVGNLIYWLTQYEPHEILQAIKNIKVDAYWKDKMEPATFLRRGNPRGEKVDYIGKLLHSPQRVENKPKQDKMIWSK